ncbi:MAG: prolyl oligopeptidase family serine peptidase [Steroidobacter sp.]
MHTKWSLFVWILVTMVWNGAHARPFTATDLVSVREIGAVAMSPDERWLVWHQRETELAENRVRSELWMLDLRRPNDLPRSLSPVGDHNAHHPSFSSDGAWIYFLSDATGIEQLWRVSTEGGSAQQVTDLGVAIAGYSLSPVGDQVAIWAQTSTACNELPCTLPQPVDSCCGSGRSFDDAYVQRGGEWRSRQALSMIYVSYRNEWMMPELRSRIYVMSVNGGKATSAMDRWLGDVSGEQVAWSRDGKTLFYSLREAGRAERFSLNLDVIASANSTATNLTQSNAGIDALTTLSPDGQWLAYVSTHSSERWTLQLRNLSTGAVTSLAKDWSASINSVVWEADSHGLLVTARLGMDEPLFRVSRDRGKVTRLTSEGHVANVIPLAQGGAIFTLDTMLSPPDLYRLSIAGALERLTAINANGLAEIDTPRAQRFDFQGAKGATVSAWMIEPEATRESVPTVLLVHDGSEDEAANSWSRRWNPMLFAAPGYAVMGIDTLAVEDLQLGLAAAARRFSGMDAAKTCIAGDGAYGGYLVYRIAGQWPRSPRCLIVNGGVVDAATMSYQTDEPWRHDWSSTESALDEARAWQTPMLILHGERDFRVPYSQSVAAFTAAQRRQLPSRLVIFPDETTGLQAPKNTIQWYGEVFNWLDRWLR